MTVGQTVERIMEVEFSPTVFVVSERDGLHGPDEPSCIVRNSMGSDSRTTLPRYRPSLASAPTVFPPFI